MHYNGCGDMSSLALFPQVIFCQIALLLEWINVLSCVKSSTYSFRVTK